MSRRVLVVTGSMVSAGDPSLAAALRRQVSAFRASSGGWLDLRLKALGLELQLAKRLHLRSPRFRRAEYRPAVERFFAQPSYLQAPELTEVVLCTLLERQGLPFEVTTWAELHADARRREELLARCDCVFASATLVRDLSELAPLIELVRRPGLRVVVGGALAGILHAEWPGLPGVDVLAVGYGERLVPALADWIRGGYGELSPPPGGRLERRGGAAILYSGLPEEKGLDDLVRPDWSLAERVHGRRFPLVHYESVRGCPYRCSFCNYPFLFDDTVFRSKSADRVLADWLAYAGQGVEWISCLDSLFTIPPQRLRALCQGLIAAGAPLRWVCYARADDLADRATSELMHAAGCRLVNVGVESGDQRLLDNMNKRCTVETNRAALRTCREVGMTTLATLFLGFPGEDADSVRRTRDLLLEEPPDFYYVGPFTTRVEYLPVLGDESRERFGIVTDGGGRSSAPYWRHESMACTEVARWLEWMDEQVISSGASLEASLFYEGVLGYDPADRAELLAFQRDAWLGRPLLRRAFRPLHRWVQRRLERDVVRVLGGA